MIIREIALSQTFVFSKLCQVRSIFLLIFDEWVGFEEFLVTGNLGA